MASKPGIPKGMRDFSPEEMTRRNYIFDTIRSVFNLYGYRQIETPSMENLSTLMGKYGEEGDKLLFKVLNSGNFLAGISPESLQGEGTGTLAAALCEKGLRYDLTVPFARYVVAHREELTLPFRRYQIQPVWRADRPQKGRYREFYQCDADVVGSDSLLNEVELLRMVDEVFARLNIRTVIKLNNRKILAGIAAHVGAPDKLVDITVAIDKLEKIGPEAVHEELIQKGIPNEAVERLKPVLSLGGSNEEKLAGLEAILGTSPEGMKGVEELRYVLKAISSLNMRNRVELDLTLARGLNYYTGCIIEVKALDVEIGSITGGGRYDNLTAVFGKERITGVGISFGADRIYDVLNTLNLYPAAVSCDTQMMFVNFGDEESLDALSMVEQLRSKGVRAELYPDAVKMKKQLTYANARNIPYVVLVGEEEKAAGVVCVKHMQTGEQTRCHPDELPALLAQD